MKFKDAKVGMEVFVDECNYTSGLGKHYLVIAFVDHYEGTVKVYDKDDDKSYWFGPEGSENIYGNCYDISHVHPKATVHQLHKKFYEFAKIIGLNPRDIYFSVSDDKRVITVTSGNYKAKSTCSREDKFDFRLGLGLALCRLKDKLNTAQNAEPEDGEPYYYLFSNRNAVESTYTSAFFEHQINYAIGNFFANEEEAMKHKDEITERMKKVLEFCNKQVWQNG